MSATTSNLAQQERAGIPALIFWIAAVSLLPAAALLGGMAMVLIGLAVCLAVLVYQRPAEAPGVAMLYLFAAGILLPYSSRFDFTLQSSEMYYWAAGLLVITAGAVARLGLRRVSAVPLSAKVFLAVAFAAAVYGETHGATTSYVLRQLYGVLLLIVYFGIARHIGNQELLLRRIQAFGVLCAVCFIVYYAAVFSEYGFHKEMGYIGEQAAFLATPLFIAGVERKKYSWVLGALVMLLVPALNFTRRDILTFLMGLLIALVIKVKSSTVRGLCYGAIVLVTLSSLYPPVTELVAEKLLTVPVVGPLIPEGGRDASTLLGRVEQLSVSLETVRVHPWLGGGLGGELVMIMPITGELSADNLVDNGLAYLLQKTGLVGAAAFLWLLITMFRGLSREAVGLTACLLSATIVTMFSQPAFLHFTTAPYLGTYAGFLLASRRRRVLQATTPAAIAAPGQHGWLHDEESAHS